jgi:hypothetical protein
MPSASPFSAPTPGTIPPGTPPPGSRAGRRRLTLLITLGAVLVTLVLVLVVVLITGSGGSTSKKPKAAAIPSVTAAPGADVPLGVFRGTDAGEVTTFSTWLGRPVDYVVDFSARDTWNDIARPDYLLTRCR